MMKSVPLVLAGIILAMDGYVHGLWTDRWQLSKELELAAARLRQVPMALGDWQGESNPPISQREVEQAGFQDYVSRRYQNQRTGAVVTILLACGRPGPLAVHTPDICYRGAGFQALQAPARHVENYGPDNAEAEFWKGQFGKPDSSEPMQQRILWSWSARGVWKAPDNPRLAFGGAAALYKLYVVYQMFPNDPRADEICRDFVAQLLPRLGKSLFR
jgi:Protein of unknown function (DUF3485)